MHGDEEIEITLVAICPEAGQRDVGVTVAAGDAVATATWRVRCSDGNAVVLAVEHYQGPMARNWRSAMDQWDVHTPTLAGRRAALVARVGHDSPAVPEVSVRVHDAAGGELASQLAALLDPSTSPPEESESGLWETEHTFDLPGELYLPENRTRFEVDPGNAIVETDETDNAADLEVVAEELPTFRIVFIPIRSTVGEPAAIDAEAYMTHIYDYFPIADGYVAEVGDTFVFDAATWDQYDATTELLHLWNTEADGDEYWHGIYKYPFDGSSCGYAFLSSHVSIAAGVNDGCTPNVNAHEVGHNLNLRHPRDGCGAGNVDQDFPYDGAGIGPRRGWFFSAGRFVDPEDGFADTMSYCDPDYFISDYHYRKAFDHLRTADDPETSATIAADIRLPVGPEPLAGNAVGGNTKEDDSDPSSTPRSIALTGVVDAWGGWSVRQTTFSKKAPRVPSRLDGRYEIVLVDALDIEVHREPLALNPGSQEDGSAAWVVRLPIPANPPAFLVIRDDKGYVLIRHDLPAPRDGQP